MKGVDEGGWPSLSLGEAIAQLCAPGALFEMDIVETSHGPLRSWKNQPQSLPALARRARSLFGSRTFLVFEDERISYEGWFRAVVALAAELQRAGIGRGDRVALAMRNLPEWPVCFFAITSLGAIVVPLNAWWTGAELSYGLNQSGATILLCDAERWHRVEPHLGELPDLLDVLVCRAGAGMLDAPARSLEAVIGSSRDYGALTDQDLPAIEIAPDDDATIFYTSGTTGAPKGALGSHRNNLTSTMAGSFATMRGMLRRGEEPIMPAAKVALLVIPFFHVTACHSVMMSNMMTGGTLVLMHKWDPIKAFELIARERVTTTGGVPTIAWQMLEHPGRDLHDLSSLESVAYGGAPSAPELVRQVQSHLGAMPSNGWGMTETSATVTSHGAEDYLNRPDSCGAPLPVSDIRVMSADGRDVLPTGAVGELWARGPQVVKGYWRNPEATAATFVDGWVRTGDLARIDEEGFCFIVDRAKDIIIRGGENIYPGEVENILYEHPAVTDAALVGLAHRTLGEEPAAAVHLAPGATATEEELKQLVRDRLAPFKVPVRILFSAETLPRNANGKIVKSEVRAMFEISRIKPPRNGEV